MMIFARVPRTAGLWTTVLVTGLVTCSHASLGECISWSLEEIGEARHHMSSSQNSSCKA